MNSAPRAKRRRSSCRPIGKSLAPGWDQVACIRANIVDENGVLVPGANVPVTFKVNGPGKVVAADSSDNASQESFQAEKRATFMGWCIAMVKATGNSGDIQIEASSPDLATGSTLLHASK